MSTSVPAPPTASRKPEDTVFKQQLLPAWQPTMGPPFAIGFLVLIGLAFIPLGASVIVASDKAFELVMRYDDAQKCSFLARRPELRYACSPINLTFTLSRTLEAPAFLYYELRNYYQNHRRYAKSKSDLQLSGDSENFVTFTDCAPLQFVDQYAPLRGNTSVPFGDSGLLVDVATLAYDPCGVIPWTMFNDSFVLSKWDASANAYVTVCDGDNFDAVGNPRDPSVGNLCEKRGIAWPSDPGVKYQSVVRDVGLERLRLTGRGWPETAANASSFAVFAKRGWYVGEEGHAIPDPVDEDLMVWARVATRSQFRKLYRRITVDLTPGTYQVLIFQRSDLPPTQKAFVLATTSWIGSKNYFLGGLYVASGAVCWILAAAFALKHTRSPKRVNV